VKKLNRFESVLAALVLFFASTTGIELLSSKSAKVTSGKDCSLDNVIGATKVGSGWSAPAGKSIVLQGWFANIKTGEAPQSIQLEIVNQRDVVLTSSSTAPNASRPDVAKAYGNSVFTLVGYGLAIKVPSQSGEYVIETAGKTGSTLQICSNITSLKVT
jgi:hypothetical protein